MMFGVQIMVCMQKVILVIEKSIFQYCKVLGVFFLVFFCLCPMSCGILVS